MSGGRRISARRLAEVAAALTPPDRAVLDSLRRVRLATGEQLTRLHFADRSSAARQARRRLARLVERRLVARLDRRIGGVRAGSSGFVYALDVAGQRLLDAETPPRWPRRPWTPGLAFLAHSLAVTELYVGLVEAERTGSVDVLDFTTEPACWRSYTDPLGGVTVVKPDAFVCLGVGEYVDAWFIEVDRGTEAPSTLARKADTYTAYWQSGGEQAAHGVFPRVLFVVPDEARKTVVVDVLARQPAEAWPLFQVVTSEHAGRVLTGGSP